MREREENVREEQRIKREIEQLKLQREKYPPFGIFWLTYCLERLSQRAKSTSRLRIVISWLRLN